jgi:hypothetical protein
MRFVGFMLLGHKRNAILEALKMKQPHLYKITELLENSMREERKTAAYANRLLHTSLGDRKLTIENMA